MFFLVENRRHFASDNNAGICPEAIAAIARWNTGHVPAYGSDSVTVKAQSIIQDIFETDCSSYFVFNGTAANSLAVGSFCDRQDAVLCHRYSHIETDECNAPGFLNPGLKVIAVEGTKGKIQPDLLNAKLAGSREIHASQPRVLSLTNTTELGTLYRPQEIGQLCELAKGRNVAVHVDGARFANAVASSRSSPAELSWKAGVDVLVFGGTKNGLAFGEAVIFFEKHASKRFLYRMKQAGQLASKLRFLAAQWLGILENGRWISYAEHANAMARRLNDLLRTIPSVEIPFPCEGNAVFAHLPEPVVTGLHRMGWRFYSDVGPGGGSRLMCSWDTTPEDVDQFGADIRRLCNDGYA
ncbi:MAG: low specificity L-threonine aldolase [Verrucomicrobia bacterium]|nr:low specificity L-threonine aldolase [Verrucomicrobiota bacterium]